jgi:hypothetical protein
MRRRLAPDDLAKRFNQPERSRPKPFDDGWVQESFSLPRGQARAKAEAWFKKYPKEAYITAVESHFDLPGDRIEFTVRRLRTAD